MWAGSLSTPGFFAIKARGEGSEVKPVDVSKVHSCADLFILIAVVKEYPPSGMSLEDLSGRRRGGVIYWS